MTRPRWKPSRHFPSKRWRRKIARCFMWGVSPDLPGAFDVIKAWGFEYKTIGFSWTKQNPSGEGLLMGIGYCTRANLECCLLATRGAPTRLAIDVPAILAPVANIRQSRKKSASGSSACLLDPIRIVRKGGNARLDGLGERITGRLRAAARISSTEGGGVMGKFSRAKGYRCEAGIVNALKAAGIVELSAFPSRGAGRPILRRHRNRSTPLMN